MRIGLDLELKKRLMAFALAKTMEQSRLPTSFKPNPENRRYLRPWKYYVTDMAIMFPVDSSG